MTRLNALHHASKNGDLDVVKVLVEKGAAVDCRTTKAFQETAFHFACKNGHLSVVQYLIENGADDTILTGACRCCCFFPVTGLTLAKHWGRADVVEYLKNNVVHANELVTPVVATMEMERV